MAFGFVLIGSGFLFAHTHSQWNKTEVVETEDRAIVQEQEISKEVFDVSYIVQEGDTLSAILELQNIKNEEAMKMTEAFDLVHSVSQIKIGNIININFNDELETVKFLQYQIDSETMLKLEKIENIWIAREEIIEYDARKVNVKGEISSSLFETGVELGLGYVTILKMSDILSGEIDFSTDIQVGDSFRVLYEKRYLENEFVMDGKVLAVEFSNMGKVFQSYRFNNGEKDEYYNENGDSMRKAFLRSPLNFRYISSGYSSGRYHPILKKVLAHYAIDYAAAYGTPVISVGNGKIIFASYKTGYGNYVIISHANSYVTQYAHLAGFAKGIKYGVRVEQGQTIGFVGSTGYSTGPHLDYSMKKNGVLINPMTVNIPSGEAVPEELKEEYLLHIEDLKSQLIK